MNVTIVGAGAVGLVVGAFLARAGHRVELVVRVEPGPRATRITDARTRHTLVAAVLEARRAIDARSEADVAWLAVRAEQIEAAIETLVEATVALAPIVVVAAPIEPSRLAVLRRRWPATSFLTFTPMFNAWHQDGELLFARPLRLRDIVSEEDDASGREARRDVVDSCVAAGLSARGLRSAYRATRVPFASGLALLAGWELAGWSDRVLGTNRELARRVARGIREAASVVDLEARSWTARVVRWLPLALIALVLRSLPWFLDRVTAAMWLHHGPKIAAQTRAMLLDLTDRATRLGAETPNLAALHRALERRDTGDVEACNF